MHAGTDSSHPATLNGITWVWMTGNLWRQNCRSFYFFILLQDLYRDLFQDREWDRKRLEKRERKVLHWKKWVCGWWDVERSVNKSKSGTLKYIRGKEWGVRMNERTVWKMLLLSVFLLVKTRLILQPELGLHKADACKQGHFSVYKKHAQKHKNTHTHTCMYLMHSGIP